MSKVIVMSGTELNEMGATIAATPIETARGSIVTQQKNYAKMRGRKALAEMVVDGFIAIEAIIANTSTEDQALLLSQYQVSPAVANTSTYSPWIAVIWGEANDDSTHIKDLDGVKHPKWVPNTSMSVYFHTMEKLHEQSYSGASKRAEMIGHIIKVGGAQVVANLRKKGIADAAKPQRLKTEGERRDFYLEEGPRRPIDMPSSELPLGENPARFVSVLLERMDDGQLVYRGVVSKDATAALNKVAEATHDELTKAVNDRNVIVLATEKAKREGREEALAEIRAAQG